jgi:type I restriction enzyme S subunit
MHLLKYFKAMSLRPENAKEIRALILELAIRGRLTEEWRRDNPDVESASVLLERIRKEKARLVKEKVIRKEKALAEIDENFSLSDKWIWCRLIDISNQVHYGMTASAIKTYERVRLLRITDIQNNQVNWNTVPSCNYKAKDLTTYSLNENDILIARTGGTIGKSYRVANISVTSLFASYLIRVVPNSLIDSEYLKLFLECPYYWNQITSASSGTGQPNVSGTKLKALEVPLPPLPEQKVIVATVNRLLAEVDELEQQTTRFQALRQDYVTASLRALTGEDSGGAWAELRPHFQSFFNQENGVKKLRAAILELAVQGKLTARWRAKNPDVESAGVLLERIGVEKARLVREKVIRKQKEQPIIDPAPYHIPKKWAWTRMQSITTLVTDGTHHTPTYIDEGVPFLSVKNLSRGKLEFTNTRFISQDEHEKLIRRCNPEKGDVLLTKVGTTGIAVTVDTDKAFSIFVSVALLKLVQNTVRPSFLELLINSPFVKYQSSEGTQGVGNKNLVLRTIKSFILPLPPLPEQRAIVKIVDELMALCDRLAEKIEQREIIGNDFLRSSVRELLVATEAVAI